MGNPRGDSTLAATRDQSERETPMPRRRLDGSFRPHLAIAFSALTLAGCTAYAASTPPAAHPAPAVQAQTDWQAVDRALGKAGAMQPGDVYKFSLPRTDLQVTARGVQIQPALALGSWVAFKPMGDEAMVMGDLVLTEDEVSPVMLALQQGGVEQTALHNHLLGESPRVLYLHIGGHGDPVRLAETIHSALALSGTPFTAPAAGAAPSSGLDTAQVESILGYKGNAAGSVYQFSIPRAERIMDSGMEVPPSMGTAIAINFQPTGSDAAAITGDFVLLGSEVNPVLRALRDNGIEVTALHSHMLDEQPRLFFMHFLANDDAARLASGLRAALDQMNVAPPA
jgi:hypothetical protein